MQSAIETVRKNNTIQLTSKAAQMYKTNKSTYCLPTCTRDICWKR